MERLAELTSGMVLIDVDATLSTAAGVLAAHHELRGYDAVHLATALTLAPERLVFATWDRGLGRAASDAGLRVAPDL